MSSPYRDAAVPDAHSEPEGRPLAAFDVSGFHGADGLHGTHGTGGWSSGGDGSSGGNAGPAQPGANGGRLALAMIGDDAAGTVRIDVELTSPAGERTRRQDNVLIDEHGYIELTAIGGNGGRGGNGGNGGDGAAGANGSDATRWSSGSNGGNGGDGGHGGNATSGADGGHGGHVVVMVNDTDTPLLMLVQHDVRGGAGGQPGYNGAGGNGGAGGRGGSSYSWTTSETVHNSDGTTSTRTHHHSNSGGWSGSSGSDGRSGNAFVKQGANGQPGRFEIQVREGDRTLSYESRFDLKLVAFKHENFNEDAVYEPGELVRVFDVEVENTGGMPTPKQDELALTLAGGGWVRPEPGELECRPGLEPGARYKVPGELTFRIATHTPSGPSEPLEVEESILHRALLPSVRRDFAGYQQGEAIEQGRFVIRYPARLSTVTNLNSLAAGEATKIRFSVTNQSRFALGAQADCKRVLRVHVATAPDSELGDEHVVFVDGAAEHAPGAGWTRELPLLGAGETTDIELVVRLRDSAPEYLRFAAHVTLDLGELSAPQDAPAKAKAIQSRGFDIRVARPFAVSNADLLLVVNHRTTREEIAAWENLGERLAFAVAVWDLSRERHLDLERPLGDGFALCEWFKGKAMVVLDNPIEDCGHDTFPHVFLDEQQVARAAASGLDLALFGHGMPLTRLVLPGTEPEVTPIGRTYWVRWWAKPTEEWLAKQARAFAKKLAAERPAERHLVVYRFAPEIHGDTSWFNKWNVGTLHAVEMLDAAAGAVVHASVEPRDLHDPAYIASDHATQALLAMFGFDENLVRLQRLLERDATEAELAPVIDALVLDVANELSAILAPGWMGEASGSELRASLPRMEALAAAKLTAQYDSAGGAALRRLAGRLQLVARSQVAWWENVPPFRWMRRSPATRKAIVRQLDAFLIGAFSETQRVQARRDADAVTDQLVAEHKVAKKAYAAGKRKVWALAHARGLIAAETITSDTEILQAWDERVMSGAEYDALIAARDSDAKTRARLVAAAGTQHAELFVAKPDEAVSRVA